MIDNVNKIKITAMVDMSKSFYTDFLPIVSQIKDNVSKLNINENNKSIIDDINKNLSKAESILNTLNNVANKASEE
ncbi:MAG: hypothetical protein E7005_03855 [Alphaproteobacteria bacterium]|nr:hypothetical protein [Alphaproteobacteria bacterium]